MFEFKKPIIMGLCGEVVTPFMGASLTADMRFCSENMYFSLSHMKYGLHASGALPFFIPKYVGQSKAAEILYKGGIIGAKEAAKLDLINDIFPVKDFENKCIIEAKKLCKINSSVLQSTRYLLNHYSEDLNKYLELESKKFLY
jgi:enoyl-CoA hydratase/carnithine racemase